MTAPTPDPSAAAREAIERALPCFLPCVARDDDGRHDLNCPAYRRRSLRSALAPALTRARDEARAEGRREGIEEAAGVCDAEVKYCDDLGENLTDKGDFGRLVVRDLARRIRALASRPQAQRPDAEAKS
jgi:hypothetical protein